MVRRCKSEIRTTQQKLVDSPFKVDRGSRNLPADELIAAKEYIKLLEGRIIDLESAEPSNVIQSDGGHCDGKSKSTESYRSNLESALEKSIAEVHELRHRLYSSDPETKPDEIIRLRDIVDECSSQLFAAKADAESLRTHLDQCLEDSANLECECGVLRARVVELESIIGISDSLKTKFLESAERGLSSQDCGVDIESVSSVGKFALAGSFDTSPRRPGNKRTPASVSASSPISPSRREAIANLLANIHEVVVSATSTPVRSSGGHRAVASDDRDGGGDGQGGNAGRIILEPSIPFDEQYCSTAGTAVVAGSVSNMTGKTQGSEGKDEVVYSERRQGRDDSKDGHSSYSRSAAINRGQYMFSPEQSPSSSYRSSILQSPFLLDALAQF